MGHSHRQATDQALASASTPTSIEAFPLFEVLAEHGDYVQRVEPSVQGGRKMAAAFIEALGLGATHTCS